MHTNCNFSIIDFNSVNVQEQKVIIKGTWDSKFRIFSMGILETAIFYFFLQSFSDYLESSLML